MKSELFDYPLPEKLIAQSPAIPRHSSRLLVLNREKGKLTHSVFSKLPDLLNANDVLVFNQTKVFPARLVGTKETGGKIELLLLERDGGSWQAIHKGKLKKGNFIKFNNLQAEVVSVNDKIVSVRFNIDGHKFWEMLQKEGVTPLPPYIRPTEPESKLKRYYQTVYAKNIGSAAAPTAGFHFSPNLMKELENKGVGMEFLTLHVGLGTFTPLKEENIEEHEIHSEHFQISPDTIKRLNNAKKQGKRIIAVGTTTTRVLETLTDENCKLKIENLKGTTGLFIYPPFKFKFTEALITNFHLPRSTLLALVSAFVSYPNTKNKFQSFSSSFAGKAYKEAVKKNYRFYSFGDASIIF